MNGLGQRRPPGYELFMAPLQIAFKPKKYERVQFAYFSSKYGHRKQVRDDGSRYFDHPKGAAWIYIDELGGRDSHIIILTLLHDLSEDQYLLSPYRLRLNFGKKIALDVRALTKLPKGKETTEEYLGRIIVRGAKAIVSKLFDRLHNLRSLHSCDPGKALRQIAETQQYHLPILVSALQACGEEWMTLAAQLEDKIREAIMQYSAPA